MKKKGFTLIELLVVIAIIALLLSIVIPSMNMAKEHAKRVLCANNLKTLGQGIMLFAGDHDDQVPESTFDGSSNAFDTYMLFEVDIAQPLSSRVTLTKGLGHLYTESYIEIGDSYYCPSAPKPHFFYRAYGGDSGDWPTINPEYHQDNYPGGLNSWERVRSSYCYIPQHARDKVTLSGQEFAAPAEKTSQMHPHHILALDVVQTWDRISHRRNSNAGVNALYSDGSVAFANNKEAFNESEWRTVEAATGSSGNTVMGDVYFWRTMVRNLE